MPVTLIFTQGSSYQVSLVENSGFKEVIYTSDGKTPKYNSANPFEIKVTGNSTDVTEDPFTYSWFVLGETYDSTKEEPWTSVNLLSERLAKSS
jgi:hypothetical protein